MSNQNEKNNLLKTIIILVIFIGLMTASYFFIQNKKEKEQEDKGGQNQETIDEKSDWKTYRNEKYGFELKHPSGWQIYASENPYASIINIYKTGKPPFTYRNNITQVSVFPDGLSSEGPAGEEIKDVEDLTLAEEKTISQYILSNNKKPFGYFIRFKNTPQRWNDFGFAWASVEIKDRIFICHDKTKDIDTCEPLSDGLDIVGSVDELEWTTVKEILSTFSFDIKIKQ